MKTERRHELGTNALASELTVWGERLRPYTSAILLGVAAVLALYVLLNLWNASASTREAEAWNAFEMSLMEGNLDYSGVRRVASNEDLAGTRMQEWAYLAWADRQLLLAAGNYLIDRDAAKEQLGEIEAIYEMYTTEGLEPEVRNRARFSLARVCEIKERYDEAKKHYAQVQGALATVAADRLKQLETNGTEIEDVGKWLASADLPQAVIPSSGGTPGVRPGFDAPLPPATGTTDGALDPGDMFKDLLGEGATGGRYGETGGDATDEGATDEGSTEAGAESGEGTAGEDAGADGAAAGDETAAPPADTSPGDATETPAAADDAPAADAAGTPAASGSPADAAAGGDGSEQK